MCTQQTICMAVGESWGKSEEPEEIIHEKQQQNTTRQIPIMASYKT